MTKTRLLTRCTSALCLALSMATSQAAVLFSQGPVDDGTALDAAYSTTGFFGFQNADSYTASSTWTISGFRWWGTDTADLGLFTLRLLADPANAPDDFIVLSGAITKTATLLNDSAGNAIFEYEIALGSALAARSGLTYLSVFLDTDTNGWSWLEGTGADGDSLFRGVAGAPWDQAPPDLALAVIGERAAPVPEPATLFLAAIACVGALASSRRRAKSTAPRVFAP